MAYGTGNILSILEIVQELLSELVMKPLASKYHTGVIISPGLFFTAVYNQEQVILHTIYVLNKEILQKNPRLIINSGFESRTGFNGPSTVFSENIIFSISSFTKIVNNTV